MPVRLLGRLVLVLVLDALALLALSWLLPGFTLAGPGAAFGLAFALGVANSVVWPFLIRVALPFTVLTLGLGALVLNAAVLLGAAALLDDVRVEGLFEAVVVVLGLTLLTTMVGGVLALDRGDLWYRHIIRRQAKRSKLAEQTDVPGVVFLEIDGLAYDVLRRAMRDGNAPGLARWVHDRGYRIEPWETRLVLADGRLPGRAAARQRPRHARVPLHPGGLGDGLGQPRPDLVPARAGPGDLGADRRPAAGAAGRAARAPGDRVRARPLRAPRPARARPRGAARAPSYSIVNDSPGASVATRVDGASTAT